HVWYLVFFHRRPTFEIYTLSLHDALPILYVKEKKGWFMERSPDTRYEAKDLLSGNVPALVKPRTIISLSRGKWHGNITLPKSQPDRKSTRLNSSHVKISYAVFCLKKKKIL